LDQEGCLEGCMEKYISIFSFLGVFSNVLVAAAVAYIAYRQYSLAREKFKLDMFEKRFAVYKATQRFLTVILQDGKVDLEKLFDFRRDTQDLAFRRFHAAWVAVEKSCARVPAISRKPLRRGAQAKMVCRIVSSRTAASFAENDRARSRRPTWYAHTSTNVTSARHRAA